MDPKVAFFFYLGSVACFVLSALGGVRRVGPGRSALAVPVDLLALGLALFAFPTLWTVGTQAW